MMGQELEADLGGLVSEQINPETTDVDVLPTIGILRRINDEDRKVALCVERVLPDVAAIVDAVVQSLCRGGRLIYVGAGTSGRLGIADAAECHPTFGIPIGMVHGIIAGGDSAIRIPAEGVEDHEELGRKAVRDIEVGGDDFVIGIASSGRTPFVIGALHEAAERGAGTAAIANNAQSAIGKAASMKAEIVTGPEVIMGSTRMKAGTAQKMVLNMISTASMIRLGKVYSNLMVDLSPTNAKLHDRARRIVARAAEVGLEQATEALDLAGWSPKVAIVMLRSGLGPEQARGALERTGGRVSEALRVVGGGAKEQE